MDIVSVFARAVERHGDRVFVADTESRVTYREADVRTDAVAAELEAHGVAVGDTVTLSASDRTALWMAIVGAWKLGALPALAESDFAAFSAELGNLQDIMGAYFAPLQGGPLTSPAVAKALVWLKSLGITGLGQSSWGPTGFAFVASEADGQALMAEVPTRPELAGLRFELAQGCNEGARLKIG